MKRPLDRIRLAIREERYHITPHANEEMADDDLEAQDVEQVLQGGRLLRQLTRDPRGPRFEIGGLARDGREVRVVCRFLPTGMLRIITAWVPEE